MTNRKEIDGSWIESQLRRTQAAIERLKRCPPQGDNLISSASAEDAVLMKELHHLSELSLCLDYLGLIREYSSWENEWKQNQSGTEQDENTSISHCVRLSNLLLRFPQKSANIPCFDLLHQIISNRYRSIVKSTRSALSVQIQNTLRVSGYPNSSPDELGRCFMEDEGGMSLLHYCSLLVKLQTIHEHFLLASSPQASFAHIAWQRLDIVTEFCRPIVLRVRYHFTSSLDEFRSSNHGSQGTKFDLSKRYDRLVEWLLSFIREAMKAPLEVIRIYFDDIALSGWKDAIEMLLSKPNSNSFPPPPVNIFRYFLREMVLLVRSVLRDPHHIAVSPHQRNTTTTALCTITSDDALFCTSMEQMLRFDEHVLQEAYHVSSTKSGISYNDDLMISNITPVPIPRLTGIVAYHWDRFNRWVELEHDAAMNILSSVSLPLDQQDTSKLTPDITCNAAFPIFVETLVTLLHSAHIKCKVAFSPLGNLDAHHSVLLEQHPQSSYYLTEYLNRVQVPLILSYLDATLAWTKQQVRRVSSCVQKLMSSATTKSWSSSAVLWSTNLSTDNISDREFLKCLVRHCCKMIGGTACVASLLLAQSLYWEGIEMRDDFSFHVSHSKTISASNILQRMNDSVFRVSKAMVDDLASAVVESMIVDDANVASYLMKIHHILEEETHSIDSNSLLQRQDDRHGLSSWDPRDPQVHSQSKFSSLSISPDLVDLLPAINDLVNCLNGIEHNTAIVNAADMLRSSLAEGLSLNLIEVILSAPEIHSSQGVFQVSVDMQAIAELFSLPIHVQLTSKRYYGSFDRLMDILKLMTLPYHPFSSLRVAFANLAGVQHESTADYGGVEIALEKMMSDDKVVEQAQDMLRAKDLLWLDIRDALVVLFKRNSR